MSWALVWYKRVGQGIGIGIGIGIGTVTLFFFFFHNKFAFGEYVHIHSKVLKVWSVKCSQITKFALMIHAVEPHKKNMLCVIRATRKPMLMVFRATRKLILWYLEQHLKSCHVT